MTDRTTGEMTKCPHCQGKLTEGRCLRCNPWVAPSPPKGKSPQPGMAWDPAKDPNGDAA